MTFVFKILIKTTHQQYFFSKLGKVIVDVWLDFQSQRYSHFLLEWIPLVSTPPPQPTFLHPNTQRAAKLLIHIQICYQRHLTGVKNLLLQLVQPFCRPRCKKMIYEAFTPRGIAFTNANAILIIKKNARIQFCCCQIRNLKINLKIAKIFK